MKSISTHISKIRLNCKAVDSLISQKEISKEAIERLNQDTRENLDNIEKCLEIISNALEPR